MKRKSWQSNDNVIVVLITFRLKADPSLQLGDVTTININQLQVCNNKNIVVKECLFEILIVREEFSLMLYQQR